MDTLAPFFYGLGAVDKSIAIDIPGELFAMEIISGFMYNEKQVSA